MVDLTGSMPRRSRSGRHATEHGRDTIDERIEGWWTYGIEPLTS